MIPTKLQLTTVTLRQHVRVVALTAHAPSMSCTVTGNIRHTRDPIGRRQRLSAFCSWRRLPVQMLEKRKYGLQTLLVGDAFEDAGLKWQRSSTLS